MQRIDINTLILFLAVALIAGGIATLLTLFASKIFSVIMNRLNYSALSIFIVVLISGMVFYFSGFIGILILAVATLIGLIPNIVEVSRSNSMACLLIPIILINII